MDERITVAMISMNEERAVEKVIRDIQAHCPKAEILMVDSSKDRTAEIAESLGARVIRQFPPKGYGPAMEKVLRNASREVVVTMDCDGTYPAARIRQFADMVLNQGYDLVDGSRLEGKPDAMPWLNYFANWGFGAMASVLFRRRLTDLHSGMRAYRKSMIDALVFQAKGPALPVELILRPLLEGYKVGSVFIEYDHRIGVSTLRPLESAWWTLKRILNVRFA
jgi:glycosyltransferase involved in cell wall biosynthesis